MSHTRRSWELADYSSNFWSQLIKSSALSLTSQLNKGTSPKPLFFNLLKVKVRERTRIDKSSNPLRTQRTVNQRALELEARVWSWTSTYSRSKLSEGTRNCVLRTSVHDFFKFGNPRTRSRVIMIIKKMFRLHELVRTMNLWEIFKRKESGTIKFAAGQFWK